ncbi:MAG TPA: ATP-binding cassette domain-containing protein [Ramlibacter sp.]|uniref:ABC transporter ATP-binding protein n=1 Tax=Ramlibacter sp. TaxID=1917967 RepID=UPI002C1F1189|nr:ATP-binding cassette domain-containing protein [Ramlibacter sp.]HVZ42872.1 ATP-binding cassette domain-containing protein [Ramlibacter sp.]
MNPLIRVESVSSRYDEFQILHGVSFDVERATIHGLIGPNGAGKSTLIDVMTGSHRPTGGRVLFEGVDTSRAQPHAVARMGLRRTFQHPRLCWSWTLLENVMIGAAVADEPQDAKADRAQAALARLGLGEASLRTAQRADGVTQLKTQIARCLVASPRVLVLDEPSAGMDRREREQFAALLVSLSHEGMTIVLVAHDLPLIRSCTSMLSVINTGRLIANAPTAEALADREVRAAYLGVQADA